MIALDTNVLVRYLVEDDARQTALASALIARAIAEGDALFVSEVVVCETVWVLTAAYRFERAAVAGVLRELLRARHLTFGSHEQLSRALTAYAAGRGDFADYLSREQARVAGFGQVATFDKALHREPGFIPVR